MRTASLIFVLFLLLPSYVWAETINFGVIANRGVVKANAKWGELAKYLSKETGQDVRLVPVTPDKVATVMARGKVHFFLSNPVTTTILAEKHGAVPLATMKRKAGSQFGGVIISRRGSGINSSSDLKGKKVMAFKFGKSAAAYVFQVYHLKQKGIDAHKDFSSFREAKKQDDIVLAVKNGIMDAGFVKTGLLENMQREGLIKLSDFTIVDQQRGGKFKQVRSTALYPEWYLVSAKHTRADVSEKVKKAVLSLRSSDQAAEKAKIKGFVLPLDLGGLKDTLKSLNLAPYKS